MASYRKAKAVEFVPVLAMAAITLKGLDFVRYLRSGDANGTLTQLSSWIISVVVVLLVAQTDWADGIAVGDQSLGTINFWSVLFVGLSVGSGASFIKDTLKSVDNSNSSAIPVLVGDDRKRVRNPEEVG